MKMNKVTSVEDYKIVSSFQSLRKTLLDDKFADRLEKPLAYWALPNDRRHEIRPAHALDPQSRAPAEPDQRHPVGLHDPQAERLPQLGILVSLYQGVDRGEMDRQAIAGLRAAQDHVEDIGEWGRADSDPQDLEGIVVRHWPPISSARSASGRCP